MVAMKGLAIGWRFAAPAAAEWAGGRPPRPRALNELVGRPPRAAQEVRSRAGASRTLMDSRLGHAALCHAAAAGVLPTSRRAPSGIDERRSRRKALTIGGD